MAAEQCGEVSEAAPSLSAWLPAHAVALLASMCPCCPPAVLPATLAAPLLLSPLWRCSISAPLAAVSCPCCTFSCRSAALCYTCRPSGCSVLPLWLLYAAPFAAPFCCPSPTLAFFCYPCCSSGYHPLLFPPQHVGTVSATCSPHPCLAASDLLSLPWACCCRVAPADRCPAASAAAAAAAACRRLPPPPAETTPMPPFPGGSLTCR